MRFILFLVVILFPLGLIGQVPYALKVRSQTLPDAKIILEFLDNKRLHAVMVDTIALKNGEGFLSGMLNQPCVFIRLNVLTKSKDLSKYYLLESGNNDLVVGISKENRLIVGNYTSPNKNTRLFVSADSIVDASFNFKRSSSIKSFKPIAQTLPQQEQMVGDLLSLIRKNPGDYYSLLQLYQVSFMSHAPSFLNSILNVYRSLSPELQVSALGKLLLEEKSLVLTNKLGSGSGKPVRYFTVKDSYGKQFENTSLTGTPYIIAFSAVWCAPCQAELPKLKAIYDKFKSRGLKVIYFNDDDNLIRWQNHIKKNKLDWINVSERLKPQKGTIQKSFGVFAIPAVLLVDKSGEIVFNSDQQNVGISRLEGAVQKLFQ
jgi:cytochrome oxidase Cu insertion factor (SCO1/SenC/PrrC family)